VDPGERVLDLGDEILVHRLGRRGRRCVGRRRRLEVDAPVPPSAADEGDSTQDQDGEYDNDDPDLHGDAGAYR
jgi:hypothetical protein